eukprot:TRINITY_DN47592_c0_g1_i1.p1 TRINITY_DN47592_c0_g1~~TRINITY_DN47592_c0_g1_i1.p1  ORF type:complete len:120 (+),score=25.52 TRINITY_DN47592_c0_g1_i1:121-480(+)
MEYFPDFNEADDWDCLKDIVKENCSGCKDLAYILEAYWYFKDGDIEMVDVLSKAKDLVREELIKFLMGNKSGDKDKLLQLLWEVSREINEDQLSDGTTIYLRGVRIPRNSRVSTRSYQC